MESATILLLLMLMPIYEGRKEVLSCGQLQTTTEKTIVRIALADERDEAWPWHVAIYHRDSASSSMYRCGGTLISENAVLTAAHCVTVNAKDVIISLGRLALDESASIAPYLWVAEIIRHPNYSSEYEENDIAIILLGTNATLNDHVQPACLWRPDRTDVSEIVGQYGTVVGWGVTETGEVSNVLRKASFPVVSWNTCLRSNSDLFGRYLSDKNFCAGTRNGTGTCTGDSGGSMTFEENGRYYIRGIVSVGANKIDDETQQVVCDATHYVIFTDVAQYLPWIKHSAKLKGCDIWVRCEWRQANRCTVVLDVNDKAYYSSSRCQIIFDEIVNVAVTELEISGESDVIPELSDAVDKFENLESLQLEKMQLKVVERARFTSFKNLRKIYLGLNSISQLDTDTFDDLTKLVELHIAFNKLKELRTNTFKALKNLEIIFLESNNLEILPANLFQSNRKLRKVYLTGNPLKELHADLFENLINLEILYSHSNKLETLPADIFRNNGKLRELSVSFNQLKELDADLFKELRNLEKIYLNSNQLEIVAPGLFRNNAKLTHIYLNENRLRELPADLFTNLINLEGLHVQTNNLEVVPTEIFRSNGQLRVLRFTKNHLKEVHADLFRELRHLEEIYLGENQLEIVPPGLFRNNAKLTLIYLEFNQLKELPADLFANVINLEILYFYTNKLETLPVDIFRNNGKLRDLRISINPFKEVHVDLLKELRNLEIFHLHTNQLKVIPPGLFRNNAKLTIVTLDYNQLKELPADLFEAVPNLEEISVRFNQLEVVPPGLFRNNAKLKLINLFSNKIKKIEPNFHEVTQVALSGELDLSGNVCVDEKCKPCDALAINEIIAKVEKNCRD